MQKNAKNSLLLLMLLIVLVVSMSTAFAYDLDNSDDDLAVYNNDEFISIDNQDDGYPESVSADDDEKLDYASNTNDGYIKFNQENITVTEGEGVTVTGNLVDSRGNNPAGGDFALDVYFDGVRKGMKDLYSHKLSYDVPSSWLTVSDSPHILKFVAVEEGDYIMFLEETGGLFVADSWVEITVESQTQPSEVYVDYENGLDTNDGTSASSPFKNIAYAVNAVKENGVVYVSGYNTLHDVDANGITIDKDISIIGIDDEAAIDATNIGRIFNIGAYNVYLSNLIFINGDSSDASDKRGGALYVNGATLTIDNCKFFDNNGGSSSSYGGAINLKSSTTTIKNSEFENNYAFYTGAAINAENNNVLLNISNSVFRDNVIVNNGWSAGAAICSYNTVIIDRSIFSGNRLTDETRTGKSINQYGTGSLTITNSVLFDGEKGVWIATGPTTLENNYWGSNDITKDSNPKDLGYTNADVSSYLYLNLSAESDITVNEAANININFVPTGEGTVNLVDVPAFAWVTRGTLDKDEEFIVEKGAGVLKYTADAVGSETITVEVLGISDELTVDIVPGYPVGQIVPSMSQVDSGVVSGAADFVAVNPVSSPGNLVYTVPENMTDLKSAIAIVNIYSGSGAPSYGLYSNITLNTNNGLEVLGYETLVFDKNTANDVNVYGINDHTTKQYSDYQMIYDITDKVNNLNSGDTITINVANSRYENLQYDGRIKLIGLLFAYDDGDDDEIAYWLNAGQLWTTDTANFDFSTQDYTGITNNMTLRTIALSSTLASSYKINNVVTPYTSDKGGSLTYHDIFWNNIGTNFNQGAKTNFWYQNGGASYKTNVALLIASDIKKQEPLTEVYVDYANGLDTNLGISEDTAFKTIAHALDVVADNGVINIKGVNYLDDVSANGLTIDKNLTIIGLGSDATIDARNAGRIFNIGAYTVNLSNLIFINADASTASDKRGGALYVNGATLTIDNSKFINNSGGASASYGGAINLKSSTTTIRNSEFDGNDAWYTGAAINAENTNVLLNISDSVFTNNVIVNNGWSAGAAICSYNTVIIDRSLFYGNRLTDETKTGKTINQYGTGSLTITNSVLLDGEKGVWIATGPTTLENNWWGNNDTTKDVNPKDLGYTNADVGSYLYLNITMFSTGMDVGDTASVNINFASSDDSEINMVDLPVTLTANNGNVVPAESTLVNGFASVEYTITASGNNSVTANVLGFVDTYTLSEEEVISTKVVYVNSTGGSDSNSGISWDKAFQTIEKAVSAVEADGTIYVADGLYELSDSTSANGISITKNINIIGQSVDAIISGKDSKRIFTITVGNTLNITRLTLTKGKSSSYGGAIQIEDGGNTDPIVQGYLIISDSIISDCSANSGGAIGTNRATVNNINNVTFINNHAASAGAIGVQQKGTLTVGDNCKFINNSASGRGSAMYGQIEITVGKNNLFYGNKATGNYGYGAICGYGFKIGEGTVFVNNVATSGGALYLAGNRYSGSGSYVIFINNTDNNGRPISKQGNSQSLTLNNCYWGTNEPNFSTLSNGGITASTYLILDVSADTNELAVGDSALVTVDLTKNQNGQTVDIASLPSVLPLSFTVENGNVDPVETTLVNGIGTTTYSPALMGEGSVTANIYIPLETVNFEVSSEAGTVFVNYTGGSDTNSGNSWENAVKTIEHALSIVGENNTIYIADGVNYLDDVSADGLTIDKDVSIIGMGDNVVIDARNAGRIFNIGAYTVNLSNLIFINADASTASDKRGGALYVNGTTLTVDNCKFINNSGGASASYGGAINLKSSTTTIRNSEFDGNDAWYAGAAINAENTNVLLNISDSVFTNNVIVNNGWSAGAAICSYNTVIIDRSLFYGNRLTDETRNGKTINQYATGSLTITNSILLDGEKGVWIATGPTTLENNWWGNNDATALTNPKDLGYTNADVGSYLVLSSTLSKEPVYIGDSITVTTTLDNNVIELPVVMESILGTITPNETSMTTSIVATYNADAVGDEIITIDVLGVKNEIPFAVKETLPNVGITNVKTPWNDGIYPAVENNFTITLNNAEDDSVEGLVLEVYSNETGELIASYPIDSLASGSSSIIITDPTIRPLTEETVWPAAQNNKIKFTFNLMRGEDLVSTVSVDKMLAYNGYLNKTYAYGGHDNIINRNYTVSGDVIISTQDVSVYMDQFSRYRNEIWNIETPEDAEVVKAFLYFNYNWDTSFFPDGWTLKFNDFEITADYLTHETDRGNLGGWGAYNYGLLVFDVTDYYKVNEENNFEINKTGNCALYPSTLIVLYDMPDSDTLKEVYFSDICDVYYPNYNQVGYDELIKHIVNFNDLDLENVVGADWYVFAASSSMNNYLSFNGETVENPFSGYGSNDCRPYVYDVNEIIGENNEAWFISTAQSSTTVGYEQILVLTKEIVKFTEVNVTKVWNDSDNQDGIRPENVVVELLANGEKVDEVTLSDDNDWMFTFADLPVKKDGSPIEYTINEVSVEGYDVEITSEVEGNFVVTNTQIHVLKNVTVKALADSVNVGDDVTIDVTLDDETATGNVSVTIDGNDYSSTIENGAATIVIPDLVAGEYELDVLYSGDENFNPANSTVSFSVDKYALDFTKAKGHPGRVDVGATVEVILSESDATGTVSVIVDGSEYSADLVDGAAVITLPLLPADVYEFDVIYSGDEKYENNTAPVTVNVNKYYPTMKATALSVRVDQSATVNVVLPSDATGTVSITVDGSEYTADVIDGTASIVLPVISEDGLHPFDVVYSGDDKYRPQTAGVDVNVMKYKVSMKATARTVKLGDDVTVNVALSEGATGEVSITINDTVYTGVVEDGAGSIIIPNLPIGQYALDVYYTGDDYYKPGTAVVTFNVNKQTTSMKATARTVKVGDDVTVNVALASDATGDVFIDVNGTNYTATVEEGVATIVIPDLPYGQYAFDVVYSGDDKYKTRTATVTFNVNKQTTTMKATARTVKVGDNVTVNVALASDVTGDVIITINDTDYSATVEDGIATIVIPDLPAGQYALDVKYGGDDKYKNQSTTVTFNVNKYNVKMKATAKYYEEGGFAMVTVTLSDDATGTVSVDVNGTEYTVNVANAKALIAIPDLAAGEYTLDVNYSGDAKYKEYASTVGLVVTA